MQYPEYHLRKNTIPIIPKIETHKALRTNAKGLESTFYEGLLLKFGEFVFIDTTVKINGISYTPDVTYIDKRENIFIDIEIDEPYSKSGDPIHYIDNEKDEYRNKLFTQNGWYVIRFSEYQVEKFLPICVNFVRSFIAFISNNLSEESLFRKYREIMEQKWTKEKSLEFMEQEKRDYYDYVFEKIQINPQIISEISIKARSFLEKVRSMFFIEQKKTEDFVALVTEISDIREKQSTNLREIGLKLISTNKYFISNGKEKASTYFVESLLVQEGNPYFDFFIKAKIDNKITKFICKSYYSDIVILGNFRDCKENVFEVRQIPFEKVNLD